ncbi:MAG: TetR family transcriptional regulator [Actinomycetota bacterium]|jgi:AcrR family transcriptional regulator|nr:MAG: TetR family transcriptional regulator [Actinomycetota bacterium]
MARTRHKQQKDRHQEILDAAARVITDRGLAETRIQDIAERCGVSPGLILYYFESKDRLLVEALTYANDKYYLEQSRELRRIPSARRQLERLIELSVPGLLDRYERLEEWALWLEIWVRALRDPSLAREREVLDRRWRQSIADIIRHGRETGEFPDGPDADELGLELGALIDGLAVQVLLNDTVVTPERMKEVCMRVAARLVGFAVEPASSAGDTIS